VNGADKSRALQIMSSNTNSKSGQLEEIQILNQKKIHMIWSNWSIKEIRALQKSSNTNSKSGQEEIQLYSNTNSESEWQENTNLLQNKN